MIGVLIVASDMALAAAVQRLALAQATEGIHIIALSSPPEPVPWQRLADLMPVPAESPQFNWDTLREFLVTLSRPAEVLAGLRMRDILREPRRDFG